MQPVTFSIQRRSAGRQALGGRGVVSSTLWMAEYGGPLSNRVDRGGYRKLYCIHLQQTPQPGETDVYGTK